MPKRVIIMCYDFDERYVETPQKVYTVIVINDLLNICTQN
jgi:hypothetical protein